MSNQRGHCLCVATIVNSKARNPQLRVFPRIDPKSDLLVDNSVNKSNTDIRCTFKRHSTIPFSSVLGMLLAIISLTRPFAVTQIITVGEFNSVATIVK